MDIATINLGKMSSLKCWCAGEREDWIRRVEKCLQNMGKIGCAIFQAFQVFAKHLLEISLEKAKISSVAHLCQKYLEIIRHYSHHIFEIKLREAEIRGCSNISQLLPNNLDRKNAVYGYSNHKFGKNVKSEMLVRWRKRGLDPTSREMFAKYGKNWMRHIPSFSGLCQTFAGNFAGKG